MKNLISGYITLILIISGFLVGFFAALFLPQPITGKFYELFIAFIMFFLLGLSGFFLIVRRNTQYLFLIRGRLAILYGFLLMLFNWTIALMLLIMATKKMLSGN